MSVRKIAYLRCDAPGCTASRSPHPDAGPSAVKLRRMARDVGWSHRSGHPAATPGTPEAGGDFCPDHTPNGAA